MLTDASHTKCLCDRLSTFAILAQQPREIVSNKERGEKSGFNAKGNAGGTAGAGGSWSSFPLRYIADVALRNCLILQVIKC